MSFLISSLAGLLHTYTACIIYTIIHMFCVAVYMSPDDSQLVFNVRVL